MSDTCCTACCIKWYINCLSREQCSTVFLTSLSASISIAFTPAIFPISSANILRYKASVRSLLFSVAFSHTHFRFQQNTVSRRIRRRVSFRCSSQRRQLLKLAFPVRQHKRQTRNLCCSFSSLSSVFQSLSQSFCLLLFAMFYCFSKLLLSIRHPFQGWLNVTD